MKGIKILGDRMRFPELEDYLANGYMIIVQASLCLIELV